MSRYRLASSIVDRFRFDEQVRWYAYACVRALGNIELDDELIAAFFKYFMYNFDVDDVEEARERFYVEFRDAWHHARTLNQVISSKEA